MAASTLVDLVINQKASFFVSLSVKNEAGSALNLNGYTVASKYKIDASSSDTSAQPFTSAITNAAQGEIALSLTAAQTALLVNPRYAYDVVITQTSSGFKTRIVEGKIIVSAGITPVV